MPRPTATFKTHNRTSVQNTHHLRDSRDYYLPVESPINLGICCDHLFGLHLTATTTQKNRPEEASPRSMWIVFLAVFTSACVYEYVTNLEGWEAGGWVCDNAGKTCF